MMLLNEGVKQPEHEAFNTNEQTRREECMKIQHSDRTKTQQAGEALNVHKLLSAERDCQARHHESNEHEKLHGLRVLLTKQNHPSHSLVSAVCCETKQTPGHLPAELHRCAHDCFV